MIRKQEITKCIHVCPMFKVDMDGMSCGHPYWYGKGAYANMIIKQGQPMIPPECPLIRGPLHLNYYIKEG